MKRELPSFPSVRAFEAAARHLSFKDAADELHVTQSAISHQVRTLEEFLGTTLFRRESRGVTLTEEGAAYLRKVSDVLDELASATQEVRGHSAEGPLYVRATPAFADRWLVPRLNDFHRRCPDIELHVSTSLEPASFAGDGVDVDIRFGRPGARELHAEPLLESTRFPVASPGLLEGASIRRPEDLLACVLLHNEVADGWTQWFQCAGLASVEPDHGPRFEHCNLTLRAAAEGQGVALAYSALVEQDMAAGVLVRLFDIELPPTIIYSLVCPASSLSQPRVAAFRNWVTGAVERTFAGTRRVAAATLA